VTSAEDKTARRLRDARAAVSHSAKFCKPADIKKVVSESKNQNTSTQKEQRKALEGVEHDSI
jgi:hypothetical protein